MSENCTSVDCESCGADCPSRKSDSLNDFEAHLSSGSYVKHVYAVMSGKGGVGKSLVTSLLSCAFSKAGYKVAVLDADITGPSIPRAFGLLQVPMYVTDDRLMIPPQTRNGIKIMSANLLLEHETDPIIWRGVLIGNAVKQFYEETYWGDIDYMFVDMPPGTGDVPLTVFQSLPVEGIIVVTSPQELVSVIVAKAVNMARSMHVPILGMVENMSYFVCPNCRGKHYIFGKSHLDEEAKKNNLRVLTTIPIDPKFGEMMDAGDIEKADTGFMDDALEIITAT